MADPLSQISALLSQRPLAELSVPADELRKVDPPAFDGHTGWHERERAGRQAGSNGGDLAGRQAGSNFGATWRARQGESN
ncbi:hypothetical protein ACWD5R_31165 [Streptomyces sp. NPDC002514]|uniref:hypothetical protein n=1 Tax=unclassified Streptomyces TaxID=2593676 RepID=UPI00369C5658